MKLSQYIERYWSDRDIDVDICDDTNTLTTYTTYNCTSNCYRESVDTYKLINCAKRKNYNLIRLQKPRKEI